MTDTETLAALTADINRAALPGGVVNTRGVAEFLFARGWRRVSPERAAPPSDKRVSEIRALVDSYELDPARDAMGLPAGYGVVRLDLLRELLDMVRISPIPSSAAVEAALGKLNLPQPSYWVSGTDNLRPPRPNVEEALRAAYAVDRGAAPAGDAP